MAQWLRLCAPAPGGTDSILGQDPRVQGIAAPPLDPPQKKKIPVTCNFERVTQQGSLWTPFMMSLAKG